MLYLYMASGFNDGINLVFNSFGGLGVSFQDKTCQSISGCACQNNVLTIDCSSKICSAISCVHPVKPFGHCCDICGGYIVFNISESFNMEEFKKLVNQTAETYGSDVIEYHIGRLPGNRVQLVIVDKEEYQGTSAEVINAVGYSIQGHWIRGEKYLQLSGSPMSKSGMGIKIFISVFFVVVFVFAALHVYYYKMPVSGIPFTGRLPGIFSRIQRRSDSVVSLTRRDSVMTTTGVRTAFRNPLYNSKRQRVQVEELVSPQ
ncbi:protein amnionless [Battus philenor]|uniref:protein amnionless n=1 Tax=Battus philenor TaxID=42288 RepID=UPI0035CEE653